MPKPPKRDDDYWEEPHSIPAGEPIYGTPPTTFPPMIGTINGVLNYDPPLRRSPRKRRIGFRPPVTGRNGERNTGRNSDGPSD